MPVFGAVDTVPLVSVITGSSTGSYTHSSYAYDYAINGIPFLSAADNQHPAIRKTAPYRKQRFDNATDPGEQSLDFWWTKGQSTFHGGAGQLYIDTPVVQGAEIRPIRYQSSAGVSPWTQGKVSLLNDVTSGYTHATSSQKAKLVVIQVSGATYVVIADGTAVKVITESVAGTTYTTSTATLGSAFAANIQTIATDGRYWYASDGNTVQKGDPSLPGTASSVLYAGMGGGTAVLGYLKFMLMLGLNNKVYVLDTAASSAALPTATFTNPVTSFVYTCCTEGPGAVYFAGYAGVFSTVYKFVLSANAITPTISAGIVECNMPPGEIIYDMFGYLNTNMGLATSRGIRIGAFGSTFSYGPLSVQFSSPVTNGGITAADSYFYGAYNDTSGLSGVSSVASLARVDFSQSLSVRPFTYQPDERFAWAPDLRARDAANGFRAGLPTAVGILPDGRKVFLVPGQALWFENPNKLTPSGALTTSRIRYETLDPKVAKYARARLSGTAGTVQVQVNQDTDSGGPIAITQDLSIAQDTGDVSLNLSKFTYVTVTFTLSSNGAQTLGPTLLGYQLKSLPAQARQRFIQVPLRCFDSETDSSGNELGYPGSALYRLQQIEALDSAGDVVYFQVLSPYPEQQYSTLAVIEDVQFVQVTTPTERENWGGIINLTLRTVSASS